MRSQVVGRCARGIGSSSATRNRGARATITGSDDGTLIVTANPGDFLRIGAGTDTDIERYTGILLGDPTEITRGVGSALELTGQGFDPCCNPNLLFEDFVASDGAPIGFAGNGGELWQIEYTVTTPVTDAVSDMTYTIGSDGCLTFFSGVCPRTPSVRRCASTPSPSRRRYSSSGWVSRGSFP